MLVNNFPRAAVPISNVYMKPWKVVSMATVSQTTRTEKSWLFFLNTAYSFIIYEKKLIQRLFEYM